MNKEDLEQQYSEYNSYMKMIGDMLGVEDQRSPRSNSTQESEQVNKN